MKKILFIISFIILILIQFFPIETTNPPLNKGMDFLVIKQAPASTESIEELEKGDMPLSAYTLLHPEAGLTQDQKKEMINFFKKQIKLE